MFGLEKRSMESGSRNKEPTLEDLKNYKDQLERDLVQYKNGFAIADKTTKLEMDQVMEELDVVIGEADQGYPMNVDWKELQERGNKLIKKFIELTKKIQ